MSQITFPWNYVADPTSGRPVALGSMFFGLPDLDPEVPGNQIQVSVKQEDGTLIPVAQPILLNAGGVATYLGSPVILDIIVEEFSWKVLNALDAQVYYNENNVPNQWDTNNIEDLAITTAKIEDGAITTPKIENDAVDRTKIFSDVAGFGLVQNTDGEPTEGQLDVKTDDSTLEVDELLDLVRVKDLGITYGKIQNTVTADRVLGKAGAAGAVGETQVNNAMIENGVITRAKIIDPTAGTGSLLKRMTNSTGMRTSSTGYVDDSYGAFAQGCRGDQRSLGFNVMVSGTVTIQFTQTAIFGTSWVVIFKNGVGAGIAEQANVGSVNRSYDINVSAGDNISLYHKATGFAGLSSIQNFIVYSGTSSLTAT